ncbi:unnamed protein product [Rotaria sp. Silwood2]|nr:unnamed protein product [Rotaria sp. Silwood2]
MKNTYQVDNVVTEVSSHGLTLERVYGYDFSIAIVTNFTQNHLDFHKIMDNYLQSKLLLFSKYLSRSSSAKAIINHDNPSYEHFINACPSKKTQNSFVANDIKTSLNGTKYIVLLPSGETRRIHLNIHGNFNVYNSLACIATCFTTYSHLLTLDQIIQSLENFQYVKGRFEFHIRHRPFSVVVDFTHTPDGLEKVLKCGRQILLESAENADEYADIMIATSDNSSQENPQKIIDDIVSGIQTKPDKSRLYVEVDRKKAIHLAVDLAKDRHDLILITGKGHETTQILADHAIEFNEKDIMEEKYKQMMQDNTLSTLILVASYSANLASEMAIEKSKYIISGIDDLKNGRIPFNPIGISEGTAAEDYHLRKISEGTLNYHRLISEKVIYDSLLAYIIDAYFVDSGTAEYFTNNIYCNSTLIGNDYMHKIYI